MSWLLWIINFMWLCWGLWMEIILEVRFITLSNYANINFCLKQRWSIFFNRQVTQDLRFYLTEVLENFVLVCSRFATRDDMLWMFSSNAFPSFCDVYSWWGTVSCLTLWVSFWGVFWFKSAFRLSIKSWLLVLSLMKDEHLLTCYCDLFMLIELIQHDFSFSSYENIDWLAVLLVSQKCCDHCIPTSCLFHTFMTKLVCDCSESG